MFFFFKQKTAYEMRISDWSSDVCSSDLSSSKWSRKNRLNEWTTTTSKGAGFEVPASIMRWNSGRRSLVADAPLRRRSRPVGGRAPRNRLRTAVSDREWRHHADRKSTRMNSRHYCASRMQSSACKKKKTKII